WAGAWVSFRQGQSESCSCVGWAPLPPDASCELGVGISSGVDYSCNIGPECDTFVNIWDFGSSSYSGCGCTYDRGRNSTIIIDTFNCTNISHEHWGTYCGGPDFHKCNEEIRKHGGKECEQVHVNRYDDPNKMGGKFSKKEGNQLALLSPKIHHGWSNVKDPKLEKQLKSKIASENKGKNMKATLPPDVAQKVMSKKGT